jgi:AraC-like DNA-binding protein
VRALADKSRSYAPQEGPNPTPIAGLSVYRRDATSAPSGAVYQRSIFLVTQGRKQARVGDETFVYDPDNYLVIAVPLPVESQILEASPARPFLSLAIDVDLEAVRELVARAGAALPPTASEPPQRGLAACPVSPALREAAARLLDLIERPEDVAVLGPLYQRELLYHVLKGPRGGFLRALAMGYGQQHAISEVLTTIHTDCTRAFTVPELASRAGMSESVFYEAFKAVTATTPTQYIKRLRLQEAHRRLTLGLSNVSGAAYEVGYNSLSQFTREFTRVFGANPSACLPRQ